MDPQDLEVWANHFEYHAEHPSDVVQGISDCLTHDESRLIAGSLAKMQLGGATAGPSLMNSAERFAQARRIPHLARIIELLIHEELRHASLLCAFMRDHWLTVKSRGWRYQLFAHMRWRSSLDSQVTSLINHDLVKIAYYRALESVTNCQRLRRLCRVIVSDKLAHVGFESELLTMLRDRRVSTHRMATLPAHRIRFSYAALRTWLAHRGVLHRAGHNARSFLRCCLVQYDFYLRPTPPRTTILGTGL